MLEFFRRLFGQKSIASTYKPAADEFEIEYNRRAKLHQAEVDKVLDKISAKGIDSLSHKERAVLKSTKLQ